LCSLAQSQRILDEVQSVAALELAAAATETRVVEAAAAVSCVCRPSKRRKE
jgi:hypothetical protein